MPHTVNGIGTSVVPARGLVTWPDSSDADCDAVVCFVFLYVPLVPLRVVHACGWRGQRYFEIPLRWSWRTVALAFARRWGAAMFFAGCVLALVGGIASFDAKSSHSMISFLGPAAALAVAGAFTLRCLARSDLRYRRIRELLGRHALGSSDPADWPKDEVGRFAYPIELFGTATDREGVDSSLKAGNFTLAMWAARLTAVREDAAAGEALTDRVLEDPLVSELLADVEPPFWWGAIG